MTCARTRSFFAHALAATSFCLFTSSASSQSAPSAPPPPRPEAVPPTLRFPAEQPVALSARVALLEQKVHGLEQRLKALESAAAADPCDPPYSVDPKGIRTIKPECLRVGPCDPPYSIDRDGIRVPKKECL